MQNEVLKSAGFARDVSDKMGNRRGENCNDGQVSKVMLGLNGDVETVDTDGVGESRFELRETIGRTGGNGGVEGG